MIPAVLTGGRDYEISQKGGVKQNRQINKRKTNAKPMQNQCRTNVEPM